MTVYQSSASEDTIEESSVNYLHIILAIHLVQQSSLSEPVNSLIPRPRPLGRGLGTRLNREVYIEVFVN